ncbi:hypothetical protein [Lignipirellula cremea]|uniref:hypothetical protein n=1 Tax=Lignipirellula cremea TaxID=2528010 RepID=UPI0011A4922A|nr:hypothetical protein [Lignipirellula cremea]
MRLPCGKLAFGFFDILWVNQLEQGLLLFQSDFGQLIFVDVFLGLRSLEARRPGVQHGVAVTQSGFHQIANHNIDRPFFEIVSPTDRQP